MKNRNYRFIVYPVTFEDGSVEWAAEYPDLNGIVGAGLTAEEAISEAELFKESYLDSLDILGESYPEHRFDPNVSGRLTVRLSKALHHKVLFRAEREGVSINQWINEILAKEIGYISAKNK